MRPLWVLAEEGTFLNHGSFGACPRVVLAAQARIREAMESQPDQFFRGGIMPGDGVTTLRTAASDLAAFVNAGHDQIAFIENATVGVQSVLRSVDLGPGDRILITDHTYNAVRLMVEARCAETGATPLVVKIPIPASSESVVAAFREALVSKVRLAVIDHITSPTALTMPLDRIVPLLRESGALVLVDGAHAVGQIPLDLRSLEVDWYVSNMHKWLFAPKGSAFLYASPEVAGRTRPNVVSHFIARGFPQSFDFTGTRDNSGWLAVPAAIRFFEELDPVAARRYQGRLLRICSDILPTIGARAVGPTDMCAAMRAFVLPTAREVTLADSTEVMKSLWEKDRIQVMSTVFGAELLLRVSAQVYVDEGDLHRLTDALDRRGWPGR